MYYFAYGSNMSAAQMAVRCPGATRYGIGRLDSHRLVFNREGTRRPGGVASVEFLPSGGDAVYGVVWSMREQELRMLDEIEDPSAYRRITGLVTLANGETIASEIYVAIPTAAHIPPDPEYLGLIISSARAAGLPDSYIRSLESFSAAAGDA